MTFESLRVVQSAARVLRLGKRSKTVEAMRVLLRVGGSIFSTGEKCKTIAADEDPVRVPVVLTDHRGEEKLLAHLGYFLMAVFPRGRGKGCCLQQLAKRVPLFGLTLVPSRPRVPRAIPTGLMPVPHAYKPGSGQCAIRGTMFAIARIGTIAARAMVVSRAVLARSPVVAVGLVTRPPATSRVGRPSAAPRASAAPTSA